MSIWPRLTLLSLVIHANCLRVPRPIASLLSRMETAQISADRFMLKSPELTSTVNRFESLQKPTHVSMMESTANPQCIGSSNSAEWLSYDTQCSYSVTPSEYCCEVFAEQACADPRLSTSQSTAIVNDRISGLGGVADAYLYDQCMNENCAGPCSASEGNDVSCQECSMLCQRSCLSNLLLMCMKRTCGQAVMSLADNAVSHSSKSNGFALHEKTEEAVRQHLHISKKELRDIEKAEVMTYTLNLLEKGPSVPLCTNAQLEASDVSAHVIINSAGTTFVDALLACTHSVLNPTTIGKLMNDPTILTSSEECNAVATCERNHVKLALDRAAYQVSIYAQQRQQLQTR